MLCFLHVRRRELQSVRQLHLITRSRLSGAGASAVYSGTNPSSHGCHPHSVGISPSADPFHSCTCRCTCILWYLAAPNVGGRVCGWTWVALDATFWRNRWCRRESRVSVFHCRWSPMISLLHVSHRALKLNVNAAPSPAHGTSCSFDISWGKLPFQSHGTEMLCRTQGLHAGRGCADTCPAQAVASQPWCSMCEAVLCSSLVQGKRRGRVILSLHDSKGEPEGLCHHLRAQCCMT